MTPNGIAWIVAVVSVVVGLLALHLATRGPAWPRTRMTIAVLVAVWLLLPAPVPGFEGHYAPAFLVLTFEGLFQEAGHPRTAALILAAGTAAALALLLLLAMFTRGRRTRS